MNFNKLFSAERRTKTFKIAILGIAGLIVVLFIFEAGRLIGFRKASFSYKWGENYHQNFAGPKQGFFGDFFNDRIFIDSHGVVGQIIKIDSLTDTGETLLIIRGGDNVEKAVLIEKDTVIRHFMETIKSSELKVDDFIVIIGEPDEEGRIEAKFIRIMPEPASPNQGGLPLRRIRPPFL